jgi:hypothetical protein
MNHASNCDVGEESSSSTREGWEALYGYPLVTYIPYNKLSRCGLKYKTFYNEVHVDEKWFYLVRDNARYYLTPNKPLPRTKTAQHKSHITKVMFLCALARPRYNNTTCQWFDGLIGIYPVGELDMYKR